MSEKLIWSSNMTKDYISGLEDDEKHNMLVDRGYDPEMIDSDNINDIINKDSYMRLDDSDDFMNTIAPMINSQTYNYVLLLSDYGSRNVYAFKAEDILNGNIYRDADSIEIVDDGEGLVVKYIYEGHVNDAFRLYAIPEDPEEQSAFVELIMPNAIEDLDYGDAQEIGTDDVRDILSDVDTLESDIDASKLEQNGTRIKNTLQVSESCSKDEPLTEDVDDYNLPTSLTLSLTNDLYLDDDEIYDDEDDAIGDVISDYLSDTYGFTHYGFNWEFDGADKDKVIVTNIEWDIDESLKESANGSVEKFKKLIKEKGEAKASKIAKGNPNFEKAVKELRGSKEESLTEASLTERNWKYTLKSGTALRKAIRNADGEPYDDVLNALRDCIEELRNYITEENGFDEDDFEWYFGDILEDIEYIDADEDNIDYLLSKFYDSCDAVGVWVESLMESTDNSVKQTINETPQAPIQTDENRELKTKYLQALKASGSNVSYNRKGKRSELLNDEGAHEDIVVHHLDDTIGGSGLKTSDLNKVVFIVGQNGYSAEKIHTYITRGKADNQELNNIEVDYLKDGEINHISVGDVIAKSKGNGVLYESVENNREGLTEELQVVQLTQEDQAMNIRSLIKTCWDNVDQFSLIASQLNDFGNQQALAVVNTLINDLYIAIGSFEEILGDVDPKSSAIDATDQVEAVVQVAPQVAQQMAQAPVAQQVVPVMLEKFTLDESEPLNEDVEESSDDLKKEIEDKEIQKANKEVEKYRKEKVKDSLNPDPEDVIEETSQIDESLGDDDTFDPHFYESLLKLED